MSRGEIPIMEDTINKLIEILDMTENTDYSAKLSHLKQTIEKMEFMVSVMGQFSAGKSKLINNLLEKEILPVHITETTAVITLIKYGEQEKAEVLYKDGQEVTMRLEESLALWQDGENGQLKEIETITLYVNSDLLSTGLIIADTPGINTIIQEHAMLAQKILEVSSKIIYVMGKPVSDTDLRFLEGMNSYGFSMIFVRTHMDSLKSTEEDAALTIEKEQEMLKPFTSDRMFFVSNEKEDIFYSGIFELRDYIKDTLASDREYMVQKHCEGQVKWIAKKHMPELKQKELEIQQLLDGKTEEYLEKKQEIENVQNVAKTILEKNQIRLHQEYDRIRQEAEENLHQAKKNLTKKLDNKLEEADFGNDTQKYAQITEDVISHGYRQIVDSYTETFDKMLGENRDIICQDFTSCKGNVNFSEYIPESLHDASEKITEIRSKIFALQIAKDSCEEEMKELMLKKEGEAEKQKELEEEIRLLGKQTQKIKEELEKYPEYEAQYKIVQEGSDANQKLFGEIGNMLDWATLLIPGVNFVTAGGKMLGAAGKAVSKLPKAGKIATGLEKAAKTLSQSKKAVDLATKIDKTTDAIKAVRGVKQDIVKEKNFLDILDYFTLEHHLSNLGKGFDREQIVEIDREYETRYNAGKREIQDRIQKAALEEIAKRRKVLDFENEKERIQMELQVKKRKQEEADQEIKKLEKQMKLQQEEELVQTIRKHYREEGIAIIENFCLSLPKEIGKRIEKCVEDYIAACNIGISGKILEKQQELKKLEEVFHSSTLEENRDMLKKYNGAIHDLEELI